MKNSTKICNRAKELATDDVKIIKTTLDICYVRSRGEPLLKSVLLQFEQTAERYRLNKQRNASIYAALLKMAQLKRYVQPKITTFIESSDNGDTEFTWYTRLEMIFEFLYYGHVSDCFYIQLLQRQALLSLRTRTKPKLPLQKPSFDLEPSQSSIHADSNNLSASEDDQKGHSVFQNQNAPQNIMEISSSSSSESDNIIERITKRMADAEQLKISDKKRYDTDQKQFKTGQFIRAQADSITRFVNEKLAESNRRENPLPPKYRKQENVGLSTQFADIQKIMQAVSPLEQKSQIKQNNKPDKSLLSVISEIDQSLAHHKESLKGTSVYGSSMLTKDVHREPVAPDQLEKLNNQLKTIGYRHMRRVLSIILQELLCKATLIIEFKQYHQSERVQKLRETFENIIVRKCTKYRKDFQIQRQIANRRRRELCVLCLNLLRNAAVSNVKIFKQPLMYQYIFKYSELNSKQFEIAKQINEEREILEELRRKLKQAQKTFKYQEKIDHALIEQRIQKSFALVSQLNSQLILNTQIFRQHLMLTQVDLHTFKIFKPIITLFPSTTQMIVQTINPIVYSTFLALQSFVTDNILALEQKNKSELCDSSKKQATFLLIQKFFGQFASHGHELVPASSYSLRRPIDYCSFLIVAYKYQNTIKNSFFQQLQQEVIHTKERINNFQLSRYLQRWKNVAKFRQNLREKTEYVDKYYQNKLITTSLKVLMNEFYEISFISQFVTKTEFNKTKRIFQLFKHISKEKKFERSDFQMDVDNFHAKQSIVLGMRSMIFKFEQMKRLRKISVLFDKQIVLKDSFATIKSQTKIKIFENKINHKKLTAMWIKLMEAKRQMVLRTNYEIIIKQKGSQICVENLLKFLITRVSNLKNGLIRFEQLQINKYLQMLVGKMVSLANQFSSCQVLKVQNNIDHISQVIAFHSSITQKGMMLRKSISTQLINDIFCQWRIIYLNQSQKFANIYLQHEQIIQDRAKSKSFHIFVREMALQQSIRMKNQNRINNLFNHWIQMFRDKVEYAKFEPCLKNLQQLQQNNVIHNKQLLLLKKILSISMRKYSDSYQIASLFYKWVEHTQKNKLFISNLTKIKNKYEKFMLNHQFTTLLTLLHERKTSEMIQQHAIKSCIRRTFTDLQQKIKEIGCSYGKTVGKCHKIVANQVFNVFIQRNDNILNNFQRQRNKIQKYILHNCFTHIYHMLPYLQCSMDTLVTKHRQMVQKNLLNVARVKLMRKNKVSTLIGLFDKVQIKMRLKISFRSLKNQMKVLQMQQQHDIRLYSVSFRTILNRYILIVRNQLIYKQKFDATVFSIINQLSAKCFQTESIMNQFVTEKNKTIKSQLFELIVKIWRSKQLENQIISEKTFKICQICVNKMRKAVNDRIISDNFQQTRNSNLCSKLFYQWKNQIDKNNDADDKYKKSSLKKAFNTFKRNWQNLSSRQSAVIEQQAIQIKKSIMSHVLTKFSIIKSNQINLLELVEINITFKTNLSIRKIIQVLKCYRPTYQIYLMKRMFQCLIQRHKRNNMYSNAIIVNTVCDCFKIMKSKYSVIVSKEHEISTQHDDNKQRNTLLKLKDIQNSNQKNSVILHNMIEKNRNKYTYLIIISYFQTVKIGKYLLKSKYFRFWNENQRLMRQKIRENMLNKIGQNHFRLRQQRNLDRMFSQMIKLKQQRDAMIQQADDHFMHHKGRQLLQKWQKMISK